MFLVVGVKIILFCNFNIFEIFWSYCKKYFRIIIMIRVVEYFEDVFKNIDR